MKSFIILTLLVAGAFAAPADKNNADAQAETIEYENDNIGTPDGYTYKVRVSNGIAAFESGRIENLGTPEEGLEVQGAYEYIGNDKVRYLVTYKAGKNGFEPIGDHLPKSPYSSK